MPYSQVYLPSLANPSSQAILGPPFGLFDATFSRVEKAPVLTVYSINHSINKALYGLLGVWGTPAAGYLSRPNSLRTSGLPWP